MSKTKIKRSFECSACGAVFPQHLGRCTECNAWNSLTEKLDIPTSTQQMASRVNQFGLADPIPTCLNDISLNDDMARFTTGFPELDRILGGGLIPGGYFLFGGDPGIGKSTLMLQVAHRVAQQGRSVLYIAGEESPHQIKMRAERLGVSGERILIYPETNLKRVIEEIKTYKPDVVIVDSIQSIYEPELSGTPGNIGQVKECAAQLMGIAKALGVTILLVGHVTKDGGVAGPKVLEHTVDGVLYFEGEKFRNLRIVRAVKNRFGNINEIGVFEMGETGLNEVTNPSELFLSESRYQNHPGSVIVATVEGNRPLLVELQALVGLSTYPSPRRVANGIDLGRLHQIVAVLERRLGLDFSKQDIYVNVVGGLRIQEPAADLGVALALVSSSYDTPLRPKLVITGEIGLTGEVRPVRQLDVRMAEAQKLGFNSIMLPKTHADAASSQPDAASSIQCIQVRSLMDALSQALDPKDAIGDDQQ